MIKYSYLLINNIKWQIYNAKGYLVEEGLKEDRFPQKASVNHPFLILVKWLGLEKFFFKSNSKIGANQPLA